MQRRRASNDVVQLGHGRRQRNDALQLRRKQAEALAATTERASLGEALTSCLSGHGDGPTTLTMASGPTRESANGTEKEDVKDKKGALGEAVDEPIPSASSDVTGKVDRGITGKCKGVLT